jgi:hypothetical protein
MLSTRYFDEITRLFEADKDRNGALCPPSGGQIFIDFANPFTLTTRQRLARAAVRRRFMSARFYVAESTSYAVEHGGRASEGVVGDYKGREKIYLHVLPITDAEIQKLKPRVDENGNVDHARLALPDSEEWWIAIEGEAAWPKIVRPRIASRCDNIAVKPIPVPISDEDLERLRKAGVRGI